MVAKYETTQYTVNGRCVNCNSETLSYSRVVGRTYQLHFDCDECGTTIKFSNDPVHYWNKTGEFERKVTERVKEIEIDMQSLLEAEKQSNINRMEIED